MKSLDGRDVFLIECESSKRAHFWWTEMSKKFASEVVSRDYNLKKLSFPEADYLFASKQIADNRGRFYGAIHYPEQAIYIILDDPERMRLGSFLEDPEAAI